MADYTNKTISGFYIIGKDEERFYNDIKRVELGELKRFNIHWIGICEKCKTKKSIPATKLAKSNVSCECTKKYYAKDISGELYGNWKVLYRDHEREEKYNLKAKYHKVFWMCECVCRKHKSVENSHLKSGKSTNCGCIRDKNLSIKKSKDIMNKKFGKLVAMEKFVTKSDRDSKRRTKWLCQCECGNKEYIALEHLTSGEKTECKDCHERKKFTSASNSTRAINNIKQNGSFGDSLLNRYSIEEIDCFWSNNNLLSPFDFTKKSHQAIIIKCPVCNEDYKTSPLAISGRISYVECPSCFHSKNCSSYERTVKDYLNHKLKLKTLHENNCNLRPINPKTNSRLYYDNEILDLNIIIEVHGKQHYEEILDSCWWIGKRTPKDFLEDLQYRDKYKKEYAINNGYLYLELSYIDVINGEYKNKINNIILERVSK